MPTTPLPVPVEIERPTRNDVTETPDTDFRRRFIVGPSDPTARSVWRVTQIYWGVVIYCGIWIILRANGIGGERLPSYTSLALTILFLIGVIHLYLRSVLTVRRGGYGTTHFNRFSWMHTAVDLSLVAATVRVTGGIESGIWPLFYLIIVAESVLEPIREARWVRFGAGFALIAATVPVPFHAGAWILDLLTRFVFLIAVSLVAQRLRQNADREKLELASLRSELALLEERSTLSREIHDGVGNALAASVLRLEVTARVVEKTGSTDTDVAGLLREEAQILREAMNGVRDWTFFNKPWSTSGDQTKEAGIRLRDEIERLQRRTGLPIRVSGEEHLATLRNGTARLAVFRIIQEALTNSAKYAKGATEAVVTLNRSADNLLLTVEDNGIGFDSSIATSGIGLASMRERAGNLGGTLNIDSGIEKGTRVSVSFPIS